MDQRGDLAKLHAVLLQLADRFAAVCEELNLRCFLVEGSLLGAVRHGGIIPWDDDIDFGMPRRDYDIFLREAPRLLGDRFRLRTYENSHGALRWFARIEDQSVRVLSFARDREEILPAWIDIFPIDGLPDAKPARAWITFRILLLRLVTQYSQFSKTVDLKRPGRPAHERFLIWVGKHISLENRLDTKKYMRKLDNLLRRYDFDSARYCINAASAYKSRSVMPADWYRELKPYAFDGRKFPGPDRAHEILSALYGDYMTLPPKDRRNNHSTRVL